MIGGDVITAVDGKAVETMEDLSAAVKAQKPGDKVELTVLRNGKEITVTVNLGEGPHSPTKRIEHRSGMMQGAQRRPLRAGFRECTESSQVSS